MSLGLFITLREREQLRKALWGTHESGENIELELKADRKNRHCVLKVLFPKEHWSSVSLFSLGKPPKYWVLHWLQQQLHETHGLRISSGHGAHGWEARTTAWLPNGLHLSSSASFSLSNWIQIPMWKCSFYFCPLHEVFALVEISISLQTKFWIKKKFWQEYMGRCSQNLQL